MTPARAGIYAATITPFGPDFTVDHQRLAGYCRDLIEQGGCDGVVPAGTTGEGPSLSMQDRLLIPPSLRQAGVPPDRVILGVVTASFGDAVRVARCALDEGYANLLIAPPFFYTDPGDESVYDYYARLAATIGDERLGLYLYNIPQMTGIRIADHVVTRLRSELGGRLRGLKDSSGDPHQLESYLAATGGQAGGFDLFPASEALLPCSLGKGCVGIISATANLQARTIQKALAAGPEAALWQTVRTVRRHLQSLPLVAAIKAAEAQRTGEAGWRRMLPPQIPLNARQEADLSIGLMALDPENSAARD